RKANSDTVQGSISDPRAPSPSPAAASAKSVSVRFAFAEIRVQTRINCLPGTIGRERFGTAARLWSPDYYASAVHRPRLFQQFLCRPVHILVCSRQEASA